MGYMTEEAAQNLADTEVEVVDWLTASGTVFNGVMADGFGYGLYHSEANVSLAYGANVPYETAAQQLVYDPVTTAIHENCWTRRARARCARAHKPEHNAVSAIPWIAIGRSWACVR